MTKKRECENIALTDACARGLIDLIAQYYASHPEQFDLEQEEEENDHQEQTRERAGRHGIYRGTSPAAKVLRTVPE